MAWGWLWALAACKEANSFAAGTLGSLGLTGSPLDLGQTKCLPWASAAGSLPRRKASDQPVWRPGGLGGLSPDLSPPAQPASPVSGARVQENGPSRQLMIRENSRGNTGSRPIVLLSTQHQHTPEVWRDQRDSSDLWKCGSSSPKILQRTVSHAGKTRPHRGQKHRGSNIIPSRTLRIQPLFLFLSKTCRLVLLSVISSSFLFQHTYCI